MCGAYVGIFADSLCSALNLKVLHVLMNAY